MQNQRSGRLHPAVGFARTRVAEALNLLFGDSSVAASGKPTLRCSDAEPPLVLVGCSGGPDSLALAALAAHFVRRKDVRVGAVIVDHQLQPGSAQVAQTARQICVGLGLSPVLVKTVYVDTTGASPEMAARTARYTAFSEAAEETGAEAVLLAHTLDDQAETVLLGLARGSGTRSLAGMPVLRETEAGLKILRPLLSVRRTQIEDICAAEGLEAWHDPTNKDLSLMRARVRNSILPFLERELGGDVAVSLARTASILGADSSYLDERATELFDSGEYEIPPDDLAEHTMGLPKPAGCLYRVFLDRAKIAVLPDALRRRVLTRAIQRIGGHTPSFERLTALDRFTREHGIAGPLQLSGHVSAWRARPIGKYRKEGILILGRTDKTPVHHA